MEEPTNVKGVQQFTRWIATVIQFISKLGEKALPFYQLLKSDTFEWTTEAQITFDDLKRVLSTSPVLVTPREAQPMLLYISTTNQVVSTVFVIGHEEEGKVHGVQGPVYYLGELILPAKQRYPH
jgi:hypothetical protein